jgi:hypothetical protein
MNPAPPVTRYFIQNATKKDGDNMPSFAEILYLRKRDLLTFGYEEDRGYGNI